MKKKLLVTGGTGYIGSHTVVKLLESNIYEVIAVDNFSNSSSEVAARIKVITGKSFELIEGDIRDKRLLENIFINHSIYAVIHFAGLKAVGESENNPLKYYDNNVAGSINLLKKTDSKWSIAILRYFNPIGAHHSGLIGDDPNGIPNNLMPFISQVAVGKRKKLKVFGGDYDTPDGTGKRDYIHVEDLALGHLSALSYIVKKGKPIFLKLNLGTGLSTSVLELVKAFEKVSSRKIKYEIVARRFGDVEESVADPSLAKEIINWEAKFDIKRMCEDSWRWQIKNPNGIE